MSESHNTLRNLARIMGYVRGYWFAFVATVALGLFKFLCPIAVIWIFGQALDTLGALREGTIGAEAAWDALLKLFLFGIGVAILNPIPSFFRAIIGARASVRVVRDIRCDLYAHVQKLSHSFYDANRSGSLTSRIIGDVQSLRPFLNQTLIQFWINLGVIAVVLTYFFRRSVVLGLLSIALIPLNVLVVRIVGHRVKKLAREMRAKLAWLSGNTQEKLAAATVVKTFTQEEDEVQRFTDDSEELVDLGVRVARLNGLNQAIMTTLGMLAPLLVVLVGGRLAVFQPETISVGLLVQFVMMQGRLYMPFNQLAQTMITTANALGSMDRIFEIFDTEPEVSDREDAIEACDLEGRIEFDHVSFSYPSVQDRPIIDDLSIDVAPRSSLALVGPSGGGKSTVARLLNRFYEISGGCIRVDGRDIRDYQITSLRSQIGLVPQDPVLFSGTILDNILYGRPGASIDDIRQAAANANALEFVQDMPEGFETVIGERGVTLSGGQRQRIAIARAFLKDPPILILDEATSSLDSESERIIQDALELLMKNRTTVVIAHRLATIRNADQIAVIEAGRLIELGSHDELLAKANLYARLCQQQDLQGL
ncbi:MAG: ABC transporter ATP-binding protein [Kiritimatiellae bacterium]|nr:ABC transporter ATP-binding protein [Kiritimatiellia bacterium]